MKSIIIVFLLLFVVGAQAQLPDSTCLDAAKTWIYRNTSANHNEASEQAIDFCRSRGDVACLDSTKDWIYRNTSANHNEAAARAIETCSEKVVCKPARERRPKN